MTPLDELRRRVANIRADSEHLCPKLKPDSPHNSILRTSDIARYIAVPTTALTDLVNGRRPRKKLQKALTAFFRQWDRGRLVKLRRGDDWLIDFNDAPLAPVVAAPAEDAPPRVHKLKIDVKTMGLKVL